MLSSAVPLAETILLRTGWKVLSDDPLTVEPKKLTVRKWASGRMPPLVVQQGASTMTSAEDLAALDRVLVTVWLQPCVVSESLRVKLMSPVDVTDPVKWSPGRTVLLKLTGSAG